MPITPTFVPGVSGTSTAWVTPTLGAGWTAYGAPYQTPRYRMWHGWVVIEGLVQNTSGGALGAANTIFGLPEGYRPAAVLTVPPFAASSMEVASGGDVRVNNSVAANGLVTLCFTFIPSP